MNLIQAAHLRSKHSHVLLTPPQKTTKLPVFHLWYPLRGYGDPKWKKHPLLQPPSYSTCCTQRGERSEPCPPVLCVFVGRSTQDAQCRNRDWSPWHSVLPREAHVDEICTIWLQNQHVRKLHCTTGSPAQRPAVTARRCQPAEQAFNGLLVLLVLLCV